MKDVKDKNHCAETSIRWSGLLTTINFQGQPSLCRCRSPYMTLSVTRSCLWPLRSMDRIRYVSLPTESSRAAGVWLEAANTAPGRQMSGLGAR